jgi:hypothetical protein
MAASIKIENGTLLVSTQLFENCCTLRVALAVYTYDQTTNQLAGNIYYHTNDQNVAALNYVPLAGNDFLMTQSFISRPGFMCQELQMVWLFMII